MYFDIVYGYHIECPSLWKTQHSHLLGPSHIKFQVSVYLQILLSVLHWYTFYLRERKALKHVVIGAFHGQPIDSNTHA